MSNVMCNYLKKTFHQIHGGAIVNA